MYADCSLSSCKSSDTFLQFLRHIFFLSFTSLYLMHPVEEPVFCRVSSVFMHTCFLCNIHSFHFCTFLVMTLFLINSYSATYSVPCFDIQFSTAHHVDDSICQPFVIPLRIFSFRCCKNFS